MNRTSLLILTLFFSFSVFAQNNEEEGQISSQEITVYNEFTPTISDAYRIQTLPVIQDSSSVRPEFNYSIKSKAYPVRFTPMQLQAAELKSEPLAPLNNGLISLGLGNYLMPYGSIYYHSKRQRNYQVGAMASHHSSHGKITNYKDRKIYSGFNDNDVLLYGKKFLRGSTLHADVGFKSRQDFFYGYNIDSSLSLPASYSEPVLKDEMEMQRFNSVFINAGILSNNTSARKMNYDISLDYNYLFTIKDYNQHYFSANLDVNKDFKSVENAGLDGSFQLYNSNLYTDKVSLLNLNPYFKHTAKNWQIKLGVNTTGVFEADSVNYHFYPNVLIQHNVGNTLIPYFSFKGKMQVNDVASIGWQNPYTIDSLTVRPSNYAQVIDIGMKGNFNRKVYFHINANYSKIDSMYFFVIDTSLFEENKFKTVYSNLEQFSAYAELRITPFAQLDVFLNGHYHYYHYLKSEEKPWHLPDFDISLGAKYHFDDKLSFGASFNLIGTRYVQTYSAEPEKLKPYIEANLSAEYKVSSDFSAFIHINNIAAQKNYIWQNYPMHRFNVMLGLNYAF